MDMQVDVRNAEGVSRFVRSVFDDQLPFATSRAINWTALDFQKDMRARMEDIFTLRRKGFARRAVKIKPFSKKETLEARVAIDRPGAGGSDRSDIFAKFETDDFKTADGSVAVPTEHVPRTATGRIKKAWRPRRVLDRSFRGGFRAFVRKSPRKAGVRTVFFDEPGRGLVALYQLVPRVSLPPDLEFVDTAQRTVAREWDDNFTRAFDQAIRTAR